MNIRYLYEFKITADKLNFSLAAEELFTSQASLSKHIGALESELGVRLFERTTHSVALSEYGAMLLPYAREICSSYDAFTEEFDAVREKDRGLVKVASIPVIAQYGITDAISAFGALYPDFELRLDEVEACDIASALREGRCEMAFMRYFSDPPAGATLFCSDELVAVLSPDHSLAGRSSVALKELSDDVFLLMDEKTAIYDECISACVRAGFRPRMAYKSHRPENIIDLVAKGMGVSLLMRKQVSFFSYPGVVCASLQPPIYTSICLTPAPAEMSCGARLFKDFISTLSNNAQH